MFKRYRLQKNFTQEKLADLTGLDTRTIQRIENNERKPSLDSLAKLIKALDIKDKDIIKYIKGQK